MNEKELQMKSEVMKRVKTVHYMRVVVRPFLVKSSLLILSVFGVASLVSVPNVINNMLNSQADYFTYISGAFFQTRSIVQVTLIFSLALFILWSIDVVKNFKYLRTLKLNQY